MASQFDSAFFGLDGAGTPRQFISGIGDDYFVREGERGPGPVYDLSTDISSRNLEAYMAAGGNGAIEVPSWLKPEGGDVRGRTPFETVTLTPGNYYRLVDNTGRNTEAVLASGSSPEELVRLQQIVQNQLVPQGGQANWRIEEVKPTGEASVVAGDLYNKPITGMIADVALPAALAFTPLGPVAGAAIGSLGSSAIQGRDLEDALLRAGITAATAGGARYLGPVIGGGALGTGAGAAAGNFAANVAAGRSVEDALKQAGLAGITAGAMDVLFPGGTSAGSRGSEISFTDVAPTGSLGFGLNAPSTFIPTFVNPITGALGSAAGSSVSSPGGTMTVSAPRIVSGLGGAALAGGAANVVLPNFGPVDISGVRVPTNEEVAGTYRDVDGNLRDNTTGEIVVNSGAGGIVPIIVTGGGGAQPTQTVTQPRDQITVASGGGGASGIGAVQPTQTVTQPRDQDRVGVDTTGVATSGIGGVSDSTQTVTQPRDRVGVTTGGNGISGTGDSGALQTVTQTRDRGQPQNILPPNVFDPVQDVIGDSQDSKSTGEKILSAAKTVVGLAPLIPLIGAAVGGGGGGGGGIADPGTGYAVSRGGIGRIRNPATFDPFTYGQREGEFEFFRDAPVSGAGMAEGGEVYDDMVSHLIAYRKGGGHMGPGQVKGIGSGQEDKIPAWLSDGEYVWSAQDVADLGDGSTDEGVRRLDKMRKMVRQRAGRKDVKKIAKPQRGIEDMLKAVGGAV